MFKNIKNAFVVEDSDQTVVDNELSLVEENNEDVSKLISRGGMNIARTIAPSSIVFHEDYFKINSVYQRIIYLEIWPNEVSINWLRSLYQWHRPIDVTIYYQPLPKDDLLRDLRDIATKEQVEVEKDAMERNSPDFDRIQAVEDALILQEMIQRNETKGFQLCLMVTIRADSLKELNEQTLQIQKEISSLGGTTRRADLRQKDAFLSSLPLCKNYLANDYTTRNMHTEGAQYTFPLANADLSHPDGIWYGINRSTNSNIILDRFKLGSPHSFILGGTGSGKSMSAKQEMQRALMLGMPVMVIDPDAECQRMSEEIGGQFITIGPSSEDKINVMDFSYIADGEEDQLTPKILSVIKVIGSMMNPNGDGYGLNAQQVKILDETLRDVYADFGYTQDPRTQISSTPSRMPILSDLRAILQRFINENDHNPGYQQMVSDIVASLDPYCSGGMFGSLFDQKTTVDLKNQFVVFNIKPLTAARSPHLLSLGMHTVLEFIWNTTLNKTQQNSGKRRLLFVDEAHIMMRSPEPAQFLEGMVRRARKFNVGVTILTQDPEDFLKQPEGRIILANSGMQILLRMKPKSLEVVADLLGLTETEASLLATRQPGEGMIFAMNDRAWLNMHTSSPLEYEMITTNPDEVAEIERRRKMLSYTQEVKESAKALPVKTNKDQKLTLRTLAMPDEINSDPYKINEQHHSEILENMNDSNNSQIEKKSLESPAKISNRTRTRNKDNK